MQNNNQNVLTNDQKDEGLKVWDGPEIDEEQSNSLNINLFTTILLRSTTSALRLKRATVLPFSD